MKDVNLICSPTYLFRDATCLPIGPMSLDWPVNPCGRSDPSGPSLPPEVLTDEQQRGAFPAIEHSRWRQGALHAQPQILQRTAGWDGCGPFLFEGLGCIAWNTVFSRQRNRESKLNYLRRLSDAIFCLQEVHGRDEFHQAIQVLAPRFFSGTFIPGNENAGGSAICIHRGLLPEEAVVTHLVICQGRDHLVNIQSGRHNLVIVDVLFEPELTLRQLRGRLGLTHPHWPAYPSGWALFWVISTFVTQKKDDLMSGSRRSPMATRERLQCFILSFPHVLEVAQPDYTRRDSSAIGIIRTGLIVFF